MKLSLSKITELIEQTDAPIGMNTKIIAVDGCGGAGKSTFAATLSKALNNCSVIHTDDFASWEASQSWYPRILDEVLLPLSKNTQARYQKYDWNKRELGGWIVVHPQKFVILEGVSSSRKEFRQFLTFGIYVKTERGLRLQRGLERDGVQAESQWLKWMKEEDDYVHRDRPEEHADLIISGRSQPENDEVIVLGGKRQSFSVDRYSFKPMTESDLPLLFRWLNEPHVKRWWDSEDLWEHFYKRYSDNILSEDSFPYIVSFDQKPIGYINYWTTEDDPNFKEVFPSGSVGSDQFIGEPEFVGKGHGPLFVKAFTDWLLKNSKIPTIMTDPDASNVAAIKCYEKAGFVFLKKIMTEEGLIYLMEKKP